MRLTRFALICSFSLLLAANAAMAFSVDDKSLTDTNGSPRFSDPDDQLPSTVVTTGKSSYGQQGSSYDSRDQGNTSPTAAPFAPANPYAAPTR